jgi:transposase InsO family protein
MQTAQTCLQYCSYDYQKKLQAYGLRPSMSGKGNCYDNASVETFFKSLKAELIWRQKWPTRRQAEAAIFQYINGFYNTRRRHSYLGEASQGSGDPKDRWKAQRRGHQPTGVRSQGGIMR